VRFLTEKTLRSCRPVRLGEEKVVNRGEALAFAWQGKPSKLRAAQRQVTVSPLHIRTRALKYGGESFLRNLGHDLKVVATDFPPDISDHEVLAYAYKERRVLITNDKGDFGGLIFKDFHPYTGVVLLRRVKPAWGGGCAV
jgi:Domain of unknown function (DUF5615)